MSAVVLAVMCVTDVEFFSGTKVVIKLWVSAGEIPVADGRYLD